MFRWAGDWPLGPLTCLAFAGLLVACAGPSEDLLALADRPTASDRSVAHGRAQLRLELARVYLERGQAWVALDEVKQALALSPEAAAAWNLRGVIYAELGDGPRAQASFDRALSLAPRDAEAAYNRAWLVCRRLPGAQDRNSQAQADLRRVLGQAGQGDLEGAIWLALANCQASAGQADQALDSLGQPGLLNAAVPETLWRAANLARKLDNMVLAHRLGGRLRERFGRSPQAAAFDRGAWDE